MRLYSILKEGGVRKNFLIILVFNLIFLPALCSGQTLQIVMINSFKLSTWFTLEITGDIDRSLQEKGKTCHYFEFGLVKDIVPRFGLNYQRIIGAFVDKTVNQFGIRFSF